MSFAIEGVVLDLVNDYDLIKDDLSINEEDEVIISKYLKPIVVDGAFCFQSCKEVDVFKKVPSELFEAHSHNFAIVKPRTEASGKTDGCEYGCWRIMAHDKLIKSEKTGKILGYKKILKFVNKKKPRECKRVWVMEEYRLAKKWNWKQDNVLCKIQLLFETEIMSFLLAKHFSCLYITTPMPKLLPAYGVDHDEDDAVYLVMMNDYGGNYWPSYVTNDVYRLHPSKIVDRVDKMFFSYGSCFFANRTKTSGRTDECHKRSHGCWRIMERDRLIKSKTGKILGFKRVFKFCEKEKFRYVYEGEEVKVIWTLEEYRPAKKVMRDKVLCVIKIRALPKIL